MGIILFCALMTTVAIQLLVSNRVHHTSHHSQRDQLSNEPSSLSRWSLADLWVPAPVNPRSCTSFPLYSWVLPVSGPFRVFS